MQIIVATTDGTVHEGDIVPESVIQAELDKVGGKIGTGDLAHLVTETVDDFIEKFLKPALEGKFIDGFDITTFTLVVDGQDVGINPDAIAWYKIIRD